MMNRTLWRSVRRAPCAAVMILALATGARASEFSDDLKARRARVMERLGPDAMLILWSAPPQRYSLDIDYEYRQDSNLYYLTGITQEGTILVLMPGNVAHREILFVKDRDPVQEHWHGHLLSAAEARERSGVDSVATTSDFEPFVEAMLDRRGHGAVSASDATRFFDALAARRARLAVVSEDGRGAEAPSAA